MRNCYIEGFLNNMRITREGFRDLAEGAEYDNGYSNILVEDSTFMNSRGVGIFVDGYVTGVTLRRLHIEGAGSTGIYLEAGSKDNLVESNEIVNNGYNENGPNGQFFDSPASPTFSSGASAARAWRSTARATTPSGTTRSAATRRARSSSTRTAASS